MRHILAALGAALLAASLVFISPASAITNVTNRGTPVEGRGPARVSLSTPSTTTGPWLEEDAGTVSHVWFPRVANLVVQSENINAGAWNATGITVANQGPAGYTDLAKLTTASVAGGAFQTITVPSGTGPWTLRAVVAAVSGTSVQSLAVQSFASAAINCYCTRSDNGACTAGVESTTTGFAYGTFGTTPVTFTLTCSANAADTSLVPVLHDGQWQSTFGVGGLFGRVSFTEGAPTDYARTATTPMNMIDNVVANVWTQNGTVPTVNASPLFPYGLGPRRGQGPGTNANYFSYATTSDPLDSTGDRYGCIAYTPNAAPTNQALLSNGVNPTAGYFVYFTSGAFSFSSGNGATGPAAITAGVGSIPPTNVMSVGCWWRTGSGLFAKQNLGTTAVNAAGSTEVAGTAYSMKIGRYDSDNFSFNGVIHEIVQGLGPCPSAYGCEAWATQQMQRAFTIGNPVTPLFTDAPSDKMHLVGYSRSSGNWQGPAWDATLVGTVPYSDVWAPPAVAGIANRNGAGPYSPANNYQGPTTLGEWAGDWSVTVVFKPTAYGASNSYFMGKSNAGTTVGWGVGFLSSGGANVFVYDGAVRISGTLNLVTVGGINVATYGKRGGNCYVRLNGGVVASVACGTMVSSAAEVIRIGELAANTLIATTTTIYEILASTTPYSDALHAARYAAVTGQVGSEKQSITTTRADPMSYTIPTESGVTVWQAPPATLAIESAGASIWKGSTNYVLNSGTHPKAAEATASLGTAAYVGWHAGSGTMTIAAGTATVTGLSCTAVSPGTLCPFTVTGAGTMTVTTSAGTVTQATIEPGTYATPYIPTAGTSVARAATVATVPLPALGNKWCASVTVKPGHAWNAATARVLDLGTNATANSASLYSYSAKTGFVVYDSSAVTRTAEYNSTGTSELRRVTGCNNSGSITYCENGVVMATSSTGGTGLWTATPSTAYAGNRSTGAEAFDGNLSNLKVCRGAANCAECP